MTTCTEDGCEEDAAIKLYIPWADNRAVCLPHGRAWAQKDGVVADPLEEADEKLP